MLHDRNVNTAVQGNYCTASYTVAHLTKFLHHCWCMTRVFSAAAELLMITSQRCQKWQTVLHDM